MEICSTVHDLRELLRRYIQSTVNRAQFRINTRSMEPGESERGRQSTQALAGKSISTFSAMPSSGFVVVLLRMISDVFLIQ